MVNNKDKRNRLARIISPVKRTPQHKFMAERPKSEGDYRADMEQALRGWRPYLDGARYHVTLKPTFAIRESILASGSEGHAFKYAEFKLNAMASTGSYRDDDAIYIWDMGAPSGTLSPIAKFTFINGEVTRI